MALYRYTIIPEAAFGTPMRSDTLYGHLLWAAAMTEGEAKVTELIEAFSDGRPPFILSSALPAGRLPMPKLPGIPRRRFETHFGAKGKLKEMLQEFKKFRRRRHWPTDLWLRNQGRIGMETLFADWLVHRAEKGKPSPWRKLSEDVKHTSQPHVRIDRQSGSVMLEGGLYFSRETWYRRGMHLDLYVQTEDRESFEALFRKVGDMGFGADRTTGRGHFSFERDAAFDPVPFERQSSHRLSLSVCVSADLSQFGGYWEPFVKHGRTWSGFGETNPFKKPFFAFAEGSVFSRMPSEGYLLREIHSDPKIVQVGWPLTIPITLEEDHAD